MSLQADLNKLSGWSDQWLLRFSVAKYGVKHIVHSHQNEYFVWDSQTLQQTMAKKEEKI
jgi:hypothetical protein